MADLMAEGIELLDVNAEQLTKRPRMTARQNALAGVHYSAEKSHDQRAATIHELRQALRHTGMHEIECGGDEKLIAGKIGAGGSDVDGNIRLEERAVITADQF